MIETYESYNPAVQLVLKHLKEVEIKCQKEDEVVCQIVKIQRTFGEHTDQIDIQLIQKAYVSGSKLAIIVFKNFVNNYHHEVSYLLSLDLIVAFYGKKLHSYVTLKYFKLDISHMYKN